MADNRLNSTVHNYEQTPVNKAFAPSRPPVINSDTIPCVNKSGYVLTKGMLVEPNGYDADTGRINVIRPTANSIPNSLITLGVEVANNGYVSCTRGFNKPEYIQYSGTAPVAKDDIGTQIDSFLAKKGNTGYVCHSTAKSTDDSFPGTGVRGGFFSGKTQLKPIEVADLSVGGESNTTDQFYATFDNTSQKTFTEIQSVTDGQYIIVNGSGGGIFDAGITTTVPGAESNLQVSCSGDVTVEFILNGATKYTTPAMDYTAGAVAYIETDIGGQARMISGTSEKIVNIEESTSSFDYNEILIRQSHRCIISMPVVDFNSIYINTSGAVSTIVSLW